MELEVGRGGMNILVLILSLLFFFWLFFPLFFIV